MKVVKNFFEEQLLSAYENISESVIKVLTAGINRLSGTITDASALLNQGTSILGDSVVGSNGIINNIFNNVALPIGGTILGIVLAVELGHIVMRANTLGDVEMGMWLKWALKLVFGIVLLSNTLSFANWLLNFALNPSGGGSFTSIITLVNWVLKLLGGGVIVYGLILFGSSFANDNPGERQKSIFAITGGAAIAASALLIASVRGGFQPSSGASWNSVVASDLAFKSDFILGLQNLFMADDGIKAVGLFLSIVIACLFLLFSVILWLIMFIAPLVITVFLYMRAIEIVIMLAFAGIPMSTLVSSDFGDVGRGYIKKLFSIGLQGGVILLILFIFGAFIPGFIDTLVNGLSDATWTDVLEKLIVLCLAGFMLITSVFKSRAIADGVLGIM